MTQRLVDTLKKKNLRITSARKAIYDVLAGSGQSLSAQSVFDEIQNTPGVTSDKVSVYRNLSLFFDLGLVHRFQDGRYAICKHDDDHEHNHGKHMHIIANCTSCGKTLEIDSHNEKLCSSANILIDQVQSFGEFSGITLQGFCKSCNLKKN